MSASLWFESLKPKVYAASIAPVLIGTALAWSDGTVRWDLAPLVLICAMLIQTISNWVNDVYDFQRGADERGRAGPRRLLAEGLLEPKQLVRASWLAGIICFLLGIPLIIHSGWPTLLIGLVCLGAAWAYTGGRFNLAYSGLGDVAAFLLFGVAGVTGTYFVHAVSWSGDAFILSLGPGLLVANILGANNLRDVPTDSLVGKNTLAVRMGATAARWMYVAFVIIAIILPGSLLAGSRGPWMLFPIVALPGALVLSTMVLKRSGPDLNPVLVGSSVLYLFYALLVVAGLVLAA